MPADPTAANPDDRSKFCVRLTASPQANGECGREVRTSWCSSTSLSPTHAIGHRVSGRPRNRTQNIAPSISLLCVIAEGAGS